ncbi:MAG: hypothetical protein JO255_18235, partial [Alphaproteobacteria bacterium]|nr:hypothetical protein [Alphaproteobacteria bacterium]
MPLRPTSLRKREPVAAPRHFIDLHEIPVATLRRLLDRAHAMKKARRKGEPEDKILAGRSLALVFEKP